MSFTKTLLEGAKVLIYYSLTNKGKVVVMSKKRFRRIVYRLLKISPNNHAIATMFRELCKRADLCEMKKKARATVVITNENMFEAAVTVHKIALNILVSEKQESEKNERAFEVVTAALPLAILNLAT